MNNDLCVEYAQNRIDLRHITQKINSFIPDFGDPMSGQNIDITQYRDAFYKSFDPLYNESPHWCGWVAALNHVGGYDAEEMEFAKLLDQKKEILKQAGTIKRRIAAYGRGLINRKAGKSHPSPNMSRRFVCKNCNGMVEAIAKSWYEKGLKHGNTM